MIAHPSNLDGRWAGVLGTVPKLTSIVVTPTPRGPLLSNDAYICWPGLDKVYVLGQALYADWLSAICGASIPEFSVMVIAPALHLLDTNRQQALE